MNLEPRSEPAAQDLTPRRRVMHFVTGGFSGATTVAADLALASLAGTRVEPVLVLRRKRHTDLSRVHALRERGLPVYLLPGWSRIATVLALKRLCLELKPDVLVAHGFPEHVLGRYAGWLAGVPRLIQVEHNTRERYWPWSRAFSRWLAARSARLVGVSEGVRRRLVELGMPEALTMAIPNGIPLQRFEVEPPPMEEREPGIVMSARFARQKDQPTLIRALALLKERGLTPSLQFAGSGKASARRVAEALVTRLGLDAQVRFLGHHKDMPGLLRSQRIFVLATNWEGMPLALVEAMAAGCACVASAAPGVEGVFEDGVSGLLVPPGDAKALADALERLLREPELAARLGAAARAHALQHHGMPTMLRRYEDLMVSV
ncbi:glycosyltransferase [Pelomonas sp. KK5]|uniref:glycosyltransferase n=1 Tax=Pelomonas sp. KK5 TaxID=1855730 RepID=UPI00097BB156|nr:glycosyltransferase [Pelomonas sp. KK5]